MPLITARLGVLVALTLLTIATLEGVTPLFFIRGVGSTPLRVMILGTAIALFAVCSFLFMRSYSESKSAVVYWYSLALGVTAIGLLGVLLSRTVRAPVG